MTVPPSAEMIGAVPALTVVAKIAPKAMKAPANTLSTRTVSWSMEARRTPLSSARTAMAAGMIASNVMVRGDASLRSKGGVTSFIDRTHPRRNSIAGPPLFRSQDQQSHNLHRDDFHDCHR